MAKSSNSKKGKSYYDLEDRTFEFAKAVRTLTKKLPRTVENNQDIRQLVNASGSVAANYIEANEAISRKDFKYRVKICRKESKESRLFLKLLDSGNNKEQDAKREKLIQESTELMKIFNAIVEKSKGN